MADKVITAAREATSYNAIMNPGAVQTKLNDLKDALEELDAS